MKRSTKIIATIGPATDTPELIERMICTGMGIARINMSHSSHDKAREIVGHIREIRERLKVHVGILMDTQGPAIRTGDLSANLDLKAGDTIALTVRGESSEEERSVDVNYDNLVDDICEGDVVLVDNGEIQLKVLQKKRNLLQCEVLTPGVLGSRRHINLPGVRVNLPALTDKDVADVELGVELGVDFFAMSFVREAQDVTRLRGILDYRKGSQKIVAKLEDQEAIRNLDEIIAVADGIMVARGDLGIECPYQDLPIIQRRIVKRCITQGTPVIVATHMLESMIENPMPTRAEVTDVANAIYEEADAVMLSGETSVGRYPLKCLEVLVQIARRIERSGGAGYAAAAELDCKYARLAQSAAILGEGVDAKALVVFTQSGNMARNAAWLRPKIPIYAFTNKSTLVNQLMLYRGVTPFFMDFGDDPSGNVQKALCFLEKEAFVERGDTVVTITELNARGKTIDTIEMETV